MQEDLQAIRAELAELRQRCAHLSRSESRNRRLMVGAGALAAGALLFGGAPVKPTEAALPGHKIRAPFTVTDSRGKPVFTVTAEGASRIARLYDRNQQSVWSAVDVPDGRGMDVSDYAGKKIVGVGVLNLPEGELRGLDVYGHNEEHLVSVDVGSLTPIKGMRVFNDGGQPVAGIGQTADHAGRVEVGDATGAVIFHQP